MSHQVTYVLRTGGEAFLSVAERDTAGQDSFWEGNLPGGREWVIAELGAECVTLSIAVKASWLVALSENGESGERVRDFEATLRSLLPDTPCIRIDEWDLKKWLEGRSLNQVSFKSHFDHLARWLVASGTKPWGMVQTAAEGTSA